MLPRFAIDALAEDAVFHGRLIRTVLRRGDAALLTPGLLPFLSLFVVESHGRLCEALPGFRVEPAGALELIRPARHRTKLLLSSSHQLNEIIAGYGAIARAEREYFHGLHSGLLAPLKRLVQPDLGICRLDGHVISTTHATRFMSGLESRDPTSFRDAGLVVSSYCSALLSTFKVKVELTPFPAQSLPRIEQVDIKSGALYRRGAFGALPEEWSAVLTMILANLNFVHRVVGALVPADAGTLLKLRTLQAFNSVHSVRRIQDQLRGSNGLPAGAASLLARALSAPEAKWLRKRDDLRDTLTHFKPRKIKGAEAEMSYHEAIEVFSGMTMSQLATSVNALIVHLTATLTEGFELEAGTFWYGRLPIEEAG